MLFLLQDRGETEARTHAREDGRRGEEERGTLRAPWRFYSGLRLSTHARRVTWALAGLGEESGGRGRGSMPLLLEVVSPREASDMSASEYSGSGSGDRGSANRSRLAPWVRAFPARVPTWSQTADQGGPARA